MPDVFETSKRSEVMSKIRATGNRSTELALIEIMRVNGIKDWRRHQDIPGRPDFVFRSSKIAVFVDGCFWHCCPKHCQMPQTNRKFWAEKLAANKKRDREVNRELRSRGWSVVRIWEHELKEPEK